MKTSHHFHTHYYKNDSSDWVCNVTVGFSTKLKYLTFGPKTTLAELSTTVSTAMNSLFLKDPTYIATKNVRKAHKGPPVKKMKK